MLSFMVGLIGLLGALGILAGARKLAPARARGGNPNRNRLRPHPRTTDRGIVRG